MATWGSPYADEACAFSYRLPLLPHHKQMQNRYSTQARVASRSLSKPSSAQSFGRKHHARLPCRGKAVQLSRRERANAHPLPQTRTTAWSRLVIALYNLARQAMRAPMLHRSASRCAASRCGLTRQRALCRGDGAPERAVGGERHRAHGRSATSATESRGRGGLRRQHWPRGSSGEWLSLAPRVACTHCDRAAAALASR